MFKRGSNKFRVAPKAQREFNGKTYHSKKEKEYAQKLSLLKKAGEIKGYQEQVKMSIDVNGQHICNYILDFLVEENNGVKRYIDVKGYKGGFAYNVFKLKSKLITAIYGIVIEEV